MGRSPFPHDPCAGPTDREALGARIAAIGREIAGPAADPVDRDGRFPHEAFDALRDSGALGAAVAAEWGGLGCTLTELALQCESLAEHCSAAAMILAMHHIQVACIARNAPWSAYARGYLADLCRRQFLIASVTSEAGVGGDVRSSRAAVEKNGERFTLQKSATTISYGAQADDFLVTARRDGAAAPGDQVLILIRKADAVLEQTGAWDTLGMRGTCSPGFELHAGGDVEQILPLSFAEVAADTMVPYSHLLWSAVWCGIARGGLGRAAALVRAEARRIPGTVPPAAVRLAEATAAFQAMRGNVRDLCGWYDAISASGDQDAAASLGFALKINNVKITTSRSAEEIVRGCLAICGIAGYRNNSPFALGRPLRDILSAALMIGNDRILATNASLLLVHKEL